MTERARLFRDKVHQDDFRVEWFDDDGGCEVAIFSGPRAEVRARAFAAAFYGEVEERTGGEWTSRYFPTPD